MKNSNFNARQYRPGEIQRRQRIRSILGESPDSVPGVRRFTRRFASDKPRKKRRPHCQRSGVYATLHIGQAAEKATTALLTFGGFSPFASGKPRKKRQPRSWRSELRIGQAAEKATTALPAFGGFLPLRIGQAAKKATTALPAFGGFLPLRIGSAAKKATTALPAFGGLRDASHWTICGESNDRVANVRLLRDARLGFSLEKQRLRS